MDTPLLPVVCAWCNRIVSAGSSALPVTYTICPACVEWAMAHPFEIPSMADGGYDGRRDAPDRRG